MRSEITMGWGVSCIQCSNMPNLSVAFPSLCSLTSIQAAIIFFPPYHSCPRSVYSTRLLPSDFYGSLCLSISISASLCTSVRVGSVSRRVSMVGVTIHEGVDDILLGGGMFGTVEVLSGLNDVAYVIIMKKNRLRVSGRETR